MRNKKNRFIIWIVTFIVLFCTYSYAAKSTDLNMEIVIAEGVDKRDYRETALNNLRSTLNYDGQILGSNMKFDTYIILEKKTEGTNETYNIAIGKEENLDTATFVKKNISKNELEKLGYNFDHPEQIYNYETKTHNNTITPDIAPTRIEKWPVVLIADFQDADFSNSDGGKLNIKMHIKQAYGGTEEDYNYGKNEVNPQPMEYQLETDDWSNTLDDAIDFAKDFLHNPMGTVFTLILNGSVEKIDVIQKIANAFQTIPLKTVMDNEIVYKYQYLKKDGTVGNSGNTDEGAGNRNKYTNVSRGSQNTGDESWQKIINIDISQTDFSSNGNYKFTNKTKIPVIVVDPYTMATSKISTFDINFLVVDNNLHDQNNSIWIKIRNIWIIIIRVTIYITSAILLVSLIIHGIILIINTTMPPNKRRKHMEGLINFLKSCVMLIGTIIIMACSIYANEMFLPKVMTDGRVELPIRVNVAEAGYSFSTTDTGYVRYMAQIQNVDLSGIKFIYVFAYFFLALRNLAIAILMMIRTILMFGLAVLGPIIVVFYSVGQSHLLPIDYRGWVRWYIGLAFLQVMLAFIFSFISVI